MADNELDGPGPDAASARIDGLKPVTIAYIAESAGVSVPTVSKVLNGRSGVSDDTREIGRAHV